MERTEVYIHVSYEPYPLSIIKNNRDKIWKRLMEVAVAEGLLPPEVLGEDGEGIYVYVDYRDPTSALVKPFLERPLPPNLADLVRRRARIFSPVGELVRGEKVNEVQHTSLQCPLPEGGRTRGCKPRGSRSLLAGNGALQGEARLRGKPLHGVSKNQPRT